MKHVFAVMLGAGWLAACSQNMDAQPSYREYEPASLFRNGRVLQQEPRGTVARDDIARQASLTERPPLSPEFLARGREQFDIYCSPCHGRTGGGDGIVVQRGMPHPPSYHIDRLRAAEDQHFFDVITNGYGVMYSYAMRVKPPDRWAIVAYIRALQLSQHATLDDVPDAERAHLTAEAPP
jgi:mono/diheme cytochrome c family protein